MNQYSQNWLQQGLGITGYIAKAKDGITILANNTCV